MKTTTQTWPRLLEEVATQARTNLLNKTGELGLRSSVDKNWGIKKVTQNISGVNCEMLQKDAWELLNLRLTRENYERINVNQKLNDLHLEREAVVETVFFKKIVRQIDVMKDFFWFSNFDEFGRTFAETNMAQISTSNLEEIFGQLMLLVKSDCLRVEDEDFVLQIKTELGTYVNKAINESFDKLWPEHCDQIRSYSKRRISVELPRAPHRTQNRILNWSKTGYTLTTIAHRDSITLPKAFVAVEEIINRIEECIDTLLGRICVNEQSGNITELISLIRKKDPIITCEIGKYTVIIDQYADFPKEKEIVDVVKNHYNLLGKKYFIPEN